jgi:hypothetical protein
LVPRNARRRWSAPTAAATGARHSKSSTSPSIIGKTRFRIRTRVVACRLCCGSGYGATDRLTSDVITPIWRRAMTPTLPQWLSVRETAG